MVQEFNVVRCYSCQTFQVEQVKKSTNKWSCKICYEKQSLKQIFFTGSGKECRINCQSLNMKRMQNEERQAAQLATETDEEEEEESRAEIPTCDAFELTNAGQQCQGGNQLRDWKQFLEEDIDSGDEGDGAFAVEFRGEHKHNNTNKNRKRSYKKSGSAKKSSIVDTFQKDEDGTTIERRYENTYVNPICSFTQSKRSISDASGSINKTGQLSFHSDARSERTTKSPLRDVTETNTKQKTSVTHTAACSSQLQSKWSQFLSVEEEDDDEDEDDLGGFPAFGTH